MPQQLITCATLPLAVYRELAAHLRQVEGIKTQLLEPQQQQFNYYQSQIGGLLIDYPVNFDRRDLQQVEDILNYYAQRYGHLDREYQPE